METHLHDRDRIGVQDAILLENYTSQKEFTDNLEKRFKENIIYTYISQVLISVNPYKKLNIYESSHVVDYKGKHFFEMPPHVFAIAETTYSLVKNEGEEQCILISGESGSGKTEASKKILQYIAVVEEHEKSSSVQDKLVQSNPLLEAFGNAKTNRNNNSSRFGKYMDIVFEYLHEPVGGNIKTYLLEKSRVIGQGMGEQNFHIFYHLVKGSTESELEELHLSSDLESYNFLTHGNKWEMSHISEDTALQEVKKALDTLEVTQTKQKEIFSILAAILNLGNITFKQGEYVAEIDNPDVMKIVCELLSCDTDELSKALTYRTVTANTDVVVTPLDQDSASYARDALAKSMYDRLFGWLVNFINESLQPTGDKRKVALGILDIYGFEIFEKNSFEQFCINFCNEKLQQLFIELTLKSEQQEYENEGIPWTNVEYFDNKVICDLIEERHKGIIWLMDDECLLPGDLNDMTLLSKLNEKLQGHKHYLNHGSANRQIQKVMGRDEFQLIHYAGEVTYNIKGFFAKNNDPLFRDLRQTLSHSQNSILNEIFPESEQGSEQRSEKMPKTTIHKFKNSLNMLLRNLRTKQPSYIRCIKPNDLQEPGQFDDELVGKQVQYLGLIENIRVRRAGYAYRRSYDLFLSRYKSLSKKTWPNFNGSAKDGVQALIDDFNYSSDEYAMGRTKIFLKNSQRLFQIEDAFQQRKHELVAMIQALWKGYKQRQNYTKSMKAVIMVQKYIRRFLAKIHAKRRREAAHAIRRFVAGFITRNGPPTEINKDFMVIARRVWLNRLSENLPKNVMDKSWPPCPVVCKDTSSMLQKLHGAHLSRIYRLKLTPDQRKQMELKVLAEKLFKDKKKSYMDSVPKKFVNDRVNEMDLSSKLSFLATIPGEKEVYSSSITKYDRHGYKERDRLIIVTNKQLHVIGIKKGSIKLKHSLPLNILKLSVTTKRDKLLLVRIPEDMMKKNKGDLILEDPNVIESVTIIVKQVNNESILTLVDEDNLEHVMRRKKGIIAVTEGRPESIHKDNGRLLVVAPP